MSSGTAALTLALLAAGIEAGDEVIVPAHTYIATALAVLHAGATPVFCDVEDETGLIDVRSAAEPCQQPHRGDRPRPPLRPGLRHGGGRAFARRHGLLVIEDAAQAHGAR